MTSAEPDQHRERLRRLLAERKRTKGVPWSKFGGSTIRGWVQRGVPPDPQDGTLALVDQLMGWAPKSVTAVLNGGEPVPLAVPASPDEPEDALSTAEEELLQAVAVVREWRLRHARTGRVRDEEDGRAS